MNFLEPLYSLFRASLGMFLILCVWISFQYVVRRNSGCKNPDKDVLDFMLNGCGSSCAGKGLCHSDPKRETR